MKFFSNAYCNSLWEKSVEELREIASESTNKYNHFMILENKFLNIIFDDVSSPDDKKNARIDLLFLREKLSLFNHYYLDELQVLSHKIKMPMPHSVDDENADTLRGILFEQAEKQDKRENTEQRYSNPVNLS